VKNIFNKVPNWARVLILVIVGVSIISGLTFVLPGETKIQTIPSGVYVLWVRSNSPIKLLEPGRNELRGWQKETDVLRNMGTENTLIAISNNSRRTQVEAVKLDPKTTVIKYIPSNMETKDGTIIQVYYNIWVKRDPSQLTRLFDERWELQATSEMDGWVAAEVIKMTDEQLKNVDGRLQIMAPADESIKNRLAEKGLIFVLSEYHFQFTESPSQ
jgi:hypothetical protein